jgi:hypothetical protein
MDALFLMCFVDTTTGFTVDDSGNICDYARESEILLFLAILDI